MNHTSPEQKFPQIAGHPKSAPFKAESEQKSSYALSIPYINQDDEYAKQKKIQNLAYYHELTRQIQEKKSIRVGEPAEKTQSDQVIAFERPMPEKYLKKHEVENHTSLAKYKGQFFGGVLQRDEAMMNKMKKLEQQREMQSFLISQIQEKKLKNEEEKLRKSSNLAAESLTLAKNFSDFARFSPVKSAEEDAKDKNCVTDLDQLGCNKGKKVTEESELGNLIKAFEQVAKEKDQLTNIYESKQNQIRDLTEKSQIAVPTLQQFQSNPSKLQKKDDKNVPIKKRENPQVPLKSPNKLGKIFKYPSEGSSLLSPMPKTPDTEQASVRMEKNDDSSRHNLDTAGKSCFIYPDSQGNFVDEIDKFLYDYGNKNMFRNSQPAKYENFTTSSIGFAPRKSEKPIVACRAVFPSDFFRGTVP